MVTTKTGCSSDGMSAWFGTKRPRVQISPLRPRRRGLCIVRDDFSFEKSSAHSRRRSSFSAKSHARLRLFTCKRAHDASATLPTFCGVKSTFKKDAYAQMGMGDFSCYERMICIAALPVMSPKGE